MTNNKQPHIGTCIREELRRQGRTNSWLADKIGITPRAIQKIFNKPSIDTSQLARISRALRFDFFKIYTTWYHDICSNELDTEQDEIQYLMQISSQTA